MAEAPLTLPLIVRAQYIKDLSFENPNPLKSFTSESTEQPSISVNIQAHAQNLSGGNFEVIMDIRVEAKRKEDVLFIWILLCSQEHFPFIGRSPVALVSRAMREPPQTHAPIFMNERVIEQNFVAG
jgi:preprotein translocase subunit SecB